jgi:hypothetical protein
MRADEGRVSHGSDGRAMFWILAAAFGVVFVLFYPATYAIDDECNILSLAVALSNGTVFLDRAQVNLDSDVAWRGHLISKFSPFHAGLLVPAILTSWRLAFLVNAAFVVIGAFAVRSMLYDAKLSAGWVALYFLNPGLLYYSRTLLAIVPASVFALLGAALLFRRRPRPVLAALAFGAAALLHIWLLPFVTVLAAGWWLERSDRRIEAAGWLLAGAMPAILAEAVYNFVITGSPFRTAYWIIGVQRTFDGRHIWSFLLFYLATLALIPICGWAIFHPRWARNRTLPVSAVVMIALASTYYYRDGLDFGVAGWIPGQRFLIPLTLLAIVPSARLLSTVAARVSFSGRLQSIAQIGTGVVFVCGFSLLSYLHQNFVRAHREMQQAIQTAVPDNARVVAVDAAFKAFAPVNGRWTLKLARYGVPPRHDETDGAYVVWIGAPSQQPPAAWFEGRAPHVKPLNSWIWNRDLWIAAPQGFE